VLQQIFQQVDYRLERLDAIQEEVRRLKRVHDEERRRELTQAALEALKGFDTSGSSKSSSNL
jgi:hypothetical protein